VEDGRVEEPGAVVNADVPCLEGGQSEVPGRHSDEVPPPEGGQREEFGAVANFDTNALPPATPPRRSSPLSSSRSQRPPPLPGLTAALDRLEAAVGSGTLHRRTTSAGDVSPAASISAAGTVRPPSLQSRVPRQTRRELGIESPAAERRREDVVRPEESQIVRYAALDSLGTTMSPPGTEVSKRRQVVPVDGQPGSKGAKLAPAEGRGFRRFLFSTPRLRPGLPVSLPGFDFAENATEATHFVCSKPGKSEPFLCSVAAGRWILQPDYLPKSCEAGRWLPEAQFEWSTAAIKSRVETGELKGGNNLMELAGACRTWRLRGGGGFAGWHALVKSESTNKRRAFEAILRAGGASISQWVPGAGDVQGPSHILYDDDVPAAQIEQLRRNLPGALHIKADVLWRRLIDPTISLARVDAGPPPAPVKRSGDRLRESPKRHRSF